MTLKAKAVVDRRTSSSVLIFDDATSDLIEVDFRGTPKEVLGRLAERMRHHDDEAAQPPAAEGVHPGGAHSPRGPGRPRLGVVPREVTLLPRHWQWLSSQRGGASVALRRLVDEARRANVGRDRVRQSQEVSYRFMSAMAGDRPGFEEAIRALFAADRDRFDLHVASWPLDIRTHVRKLVAGAFGGSTVS